ncbi:MAG: DUF488 domain-containing protein [Deltaproteobacteria bacterium]|nr:MAG: DUF488 domain-containing protein [Deltaproteobacteria bacterium]
MKIFTIGFTKKKAADFFGILRKNRIKRLIDIRLNNSSQLSGFAKSDDLKYFLKELCGADYIHEILLAPTENILNEYKKNKGDWREYERSFIKLLSERKIEEKIKPDIFEIPTVLLCSEPTSEYCHRRLVLEYLKHKWGEIEIINL